MGHKKGTKSGGGNDVDFPPMGPKEQNNDIVEEFNAVKPPPPGPPDPKHGDQVPLPPLGPDRIHELDGPLGPKEAKEEGDFIPKSPKEFPGIMPMRPIAPPPPRGYLYSHKQCRERIGGDVFSPVSNYRNNHHYHDEALGVPHRPGEDQRSDGHARSETCRFSLYLTNVQVQPTLPSEDVTGMTPGLLPCNTQQWTQTKETTLTFSGEPSSGEPTFVWPDPCIALEPRCYDSTMFEEPQFQSLKQVLDLDRNQFSETDIHFVSIDCSTNDDDIIGDPKWDLHQATLQDPHYSQNNNTTPDTKGSSKLAPYLWGMLIGALLMLAAIRVIRRRRAFRRLMQQDTLYSLSLDMSTNDGYEMQQTNNIPMATAVSLSAPPTGTVAVANETSSSTVFEASVIETTSSRTMKQIV